jgi:hypothetical protein
MHSAHTQKFKRIRVGESTGGHDPRLLWPLPWYLPSDLACLDCGIQNGTLLSLSLSLSPTSLLYYSS